MAKKIEPKLSFKKENNTLIIDDEFELPKYTIIIGKNNSGKSWLMQELSKKIDKDVPKEERSKSVYLSPERFGEFRKNPGYEADSSSTKRDRQKGRLKNQSHDFFEQAISYFNGLIPHLRKKTKKRGVIKNPQKLIDYLNGKIPKIDFRLSTQEDERGYYFTINDNSEKSIPEKLSSGTMQMIALMMYVLYFLYSNEYEDDAVLVIDEPDVHIHSDLQVKFIDFIVDATKGKKHKVVIATHSNSIIHGFLKVKDSYIATINEVDNKLDFFSLENKNLEEILPSLGAHSLSHVFNKSPLLLIEGEDDEIVWHYAIRKSTKCINFHLVEVGGLPGFKRYEEIVLRMGVSLFDNPNVYEIRDRDVKNKKLKKYECADRGFIKRSKLKCRKIENLIFSNEVLNKIGINSWEEARERLKEDEKFKDIDRYSGNIEGDEYRVLKLLNSRNGKSWEFLVGQAIGENINNIQVLKMERGSVYCMLGEKICGWLEEMISKK